MRRRRWQTEYCAGYFEEEHRLPEADHCTSRRTGITLSCVLMNTVSRSRTTFGGSLLGMDRGSAAGGVRLVTAGTLGKPQTESWSYKTA